MGLSMVRKSSDTLRIVLAENIKAFRRERGVLKKHGPSNAVCIAHIPVRLSAMNEMLHSAHLRFWPQLLA